MRAETLIGDSIIDDLIFTGEETIILAKDKVI